MLDRLVAGEVVSVRCWPNGRICPRGACVEFAIDKQKHTFRVAGICNEYSMGGLMAYMDRKTAEKVFDITGVDGYLISTVHPTPPEVPAKLAEFTEREGLLLHSFTQIRARIDDMVSGVVAGLWILLALGLLVGALGVVNTLTMNVLEQTQELGMLRAIGMPRGQLMRTVLSQGVLIAFLGIVAGAASGLATGLDDQFEPGLAVRPFGSIRDARRVRGDSDRRRRGDRSFRRHPPRCGAARLSPIEAMRSE